MREEFLNNITEHHFYYENGELLKDDLFSEKPIKILFKNSKDKICVEVTQRNRLKTNYFIGTDWLTNEYPIYVAPKINKEQYEVDYLSMLLTCMEHAQVFEHTKDLYEIKFDKPEIEISQKQDKLTPLLVISFLQIVKNIVRKGLKKSYYKVEQNLNSRVKGKILVSKTIKKNLLQGKTLNNYCSFDEFGLNTKENRIIKKTLAFVQKYLHQLTKSKHGNFKAIFNYVMPAFESVDENIEIRDIKNIKVNSIFHEYTEAIRLAKIILRRFGYNIKNAEQHEQVKTPPFWIDMSKLFELYVLALLRNSRIKTEFQFKADGRIPDFLLLNEGFVADAKYIPKYQNDEYIYDNIMQLSAYARNYKILEKLGKRNDEVVSCLIIYPNEEWLENKEEQTINLDKKEDVKNFTEFYKISVKLPLINIE